MSLGVFGLALAVLAGPAVLESQETGKVPAIGHLMERFPARPADQIIE